MVVAGVLRRAHRKKQEIDTPVDVAQQMEVRAKMARYLMGHVAFHNCPVTHGEVYDHSGFV
jgi:hypothetical protein